MSKNLKRKDWAAEFFKLTIRYLHRRNLTAAVGRLAHAQLPFGLGAKSVAWFAKRFDLEMSEAEKPLKEYKNVAELFRRKMKPGLRPIGNGLVHPVDGFLVDGGVILSDQLIQAKGKDYSLQELVGDKAWAADLIDGHLLTYYLSPKDYHHVHSPIDGKAIANRHFAGDLWPVNPWSLSTHPRIFTENERILVYCRVDSIPVLIILVGAVAVGKISLAFCSTTNSSKEGVVTFDSPIEISKGEAIGSFEMGSTVLLLYGKGLVPRGAKLNEGLTRYGGSLISL